MFENLTFPTTPALYRLSGPAGADMDTLVAKLIGAGCSLRVVFATGIYTVEGPADLLSKLAAEMVNYPGYALAVEPSSVELGNGFRTVPALKHVRSVTLHAKPGSPVVRSAVDAGLTISAAGFDRWEVSSEKSGRELSDWLLYAAN